MTRYAVAYINFFDNVIQIKIVNATTAIEACTAFLEKEFIDLVNPSTLEELEIAVTNCDAAITVLEIPDSEESQRLL